MRRLFIDTSSDYLSILLTSDKLVLSYVRIFAGRQISEIILHHINVLLQSNHLTIDDIDEFYAIIGPGSFTGVRIGVSLILGLSSGACKAAYGITSLDVAAITSGKTSLDVAARLKDDIFAKRSYDFNHNLFGDIEIIQLEDNNITTVNSSTNDNILLDRIICDDRYLEFRQDCVPIYLRKPEAELNFEKVKA